MSQAEALLNSLNDISVASEPANTAEAHIVVDEERVVHVPEELRRLGVEHDHNIETITFDCPRYWDGHDMSQFKIYINYLCPDGMKGQYLTTNLIVGYNTMNFDWVISNNVTQKKGPISFLICIVKTDAEGLEERHWNSELNQECYISEGLECEEVALIGYPDIITHLLTRMEEVDKIATPEAMQQYTNEWLEANHDLLLAEIEAKAKEALDSIPEDYAAVAALANEGARTKADAIVLEAEGNPITIEDSSDDYLRNLKLFGKTTQISTTGSQLFNPYAEQNNSVGVATIEGNGAKITVTGTYYVSWPITLTAGVEYYVDFTAAGSTVNRGVRFVYKSDYLGDTLTAIITNPSVFAPVHEVIAVYLYGGRGTEDTVVYKNFQISEGSTAVAWEPYSGGRPSPSPEYPQEFDCVTNPSVNICGKNLLNPDGKTMTLHGVTFTNNGDGSFTVKGTSTGAAGFPLTDLNAHPLYLQKGVTYTQSIEVLAGEKPTLATVVPAVKDKNGVTTFNYITDNRTKTAAADYTFYSYTLYISAGIEVDFTFRVQLEIGDKATEWEMYKPMQTLNVTRTLLGLPVNINGNYTDENGQQWIRDEIDFERGVRIQRIGVFSVADNANDAKPGTVQYSRSLKTGRGQLIISPNSSRAKDHNVVGTLCNMARLNDDPYSAGEAEYYENPANIVVVGNDTDDAVADAMLFKYNNLKYAYVLATPLEYHLSAEELAAFEALRMNRTFTSITNAHDMWMALKYDVDTKTYIDNSIKANLTDVMEAIENGSY